MSNMIIQDFEKKVGISTDQMLEEFSIERRQRISRRKLCKLFEISEPTIRCSFDIPSIKGARGEPTKYQLIDVTAHLKKLNEDLDDVWSKQYLSTRDAASFISEHLNHPVSENMLEKYRKTRAGPIFMHVTHRTIRYKIEDLRSWIEQRRQIDK